ncbi:MAG: bifunctional (p)ppGpp synthetase/guanosine-3',5'-bis(diphosphate) 3'-pyrophosphohydrolase [Alphaproteobacteria bacterium]|nr:HD domain-containing protein [Alphaproteobacteria bacterium]MDE2336032.1 bifunctional (p)ppGpp synthetase/guanosine-3',5'-bis(diphosphate) 3'-pyrophosphohydrolase [Alphaproteobacteria bacterium]
MSDLASLTKALNFAAQKHVDQRRKGKSAEPYINHIIEVANLLAENNAPFAAVMAGALHDTIEDTGTTHAELKCAFGENVAEIVHECTDDKSLPKQERKRLQAENAAHKSDAARMVKIADKISNLRSILASPPADWSGARKLEYFIWAKSVVDNCRGLNEGLEREFDKTYKIGVDKFKP